MRLNLRKGKESAEQSSTAMSAVGHASLQGLPKVPHWNASLSLPQYLMAGQDILLVILSYLNDPRDFLRLSQVP